MNQNREETVDYRELYKSWHRQGWHECIRRFIWTDRSRPDDFGLDIVDLNDNYQAMLKQCTGYEEDADRAGFGDCLSAIRSLAKRYGQEEVRQVLRNQYEEKKTQREHQKVE